MKYFSLLTLVFSFSAFAHLEVGTYKGSLADGSDCTIKIDSVFFANNIKNPLAERASIVALGKTFVVGHPAVIDEVIGSVLFSHDYLESVVPVSGGAEYFKLKMSHEEGNEGPTEFVLLSHNWKLNKIEKSECFSLKFQP